MEQLILEAVLTQLATITIANGFYTDIGERVTYYDPYLADYNGPPQVTVRDLQDESTVTNSYHDIRLALEIEAIAFSTVENKLADSCHLLTDLVNALVCDRSWWPTDVIAVRRVGRTKTIEAAGKQAINVTLNLEVHYRELI